MKRIKQFLKNLDEFNTKIGTIARLTIGTVWCGYGFFIFSLIPLVFPNTTVIVQYISSQFLQLVSVPLILFGQTVLGRITEERNNNCLLYTSPSPRD